MTHAEQHSRQPRTTRPFGAGSGGFTLVELVVVLTLIGLLLTIAAPRYFHIIDRSRDTVQRQNISTLRDAIDKFHGDLGRYPDTLDDLVNKRYLRQVPLDPITEQANWAVIAPSDGTQGAVYDIRSAAQDSIDAAAQPGSRSASGAGG
jgi:general secretion pathway protein G